MLKKFGMVSVGVTAGLLAIAPMASATEDHDSERDHSDDFSASCDFTGGDGEAASEIGGDTLLANAVAQAPIAGNNIGNAGNCSDFLNHNLNDNFSGNDVSVLSSTED